MPERPLPLAAEALLPHTSRMCCIDRLTALRDTEAEAEVVLRPDHALVDGKGRLDPSGFIELAAQTAGAMYGAQADGQPLGMAMLVSVQKVAVRAVARSGDKLRITVSVLGEIETMVSLAFAVSRDDGGTQAAPLLAEGRLTVYRPGENDPIPIPRPASAAVSDFSPAAPGNGLPEGLLRCLRQSPRPVPLSEGAAPLEAVFAFYPDFPGFDGHFPDNPIVPGIAQIMAAVLTASGGAGARLVEVKRCKFLRPVLPSEEMRVLAEVAEGADVRPCRAQLSVKGEPCAEMSFSFIAGTDK